MTRDPKTFYTRLEAAYELHMRRPLAEPGEALGWFVKITGIPKSTAKDWVYGLRTPKPWAWLLIEQVEYAERLRMAGASLDPLLWRLQALRSRLNLDLGGFLNALKDAEDALVREVGYSPAVELAKQLCVARTTGIAEQDVAP